MRKNSRENSNSGCQRARGALAQPLFSLTRILKRLGVRVSMQSRREGPTVGRIDRRGGLAKLDPRRTIHESALAPGTARSSKKLETRGT